MQVGSKNMNHHVSWWKPDTCLSVSFLCQPPAFPASTMLRKALILCPVHPGWLSHTTLGIHHYSRVNHWRVFGEHTGFGLSIDVESNTLRFEGEATQATADYNSVHTESLLVTTMQMSFCLFPGGHGWSTRQAQHPHGKQWVCHSTCLKWRKFLISCYHYSATLLSKKILSFWMSLPLYYRTLS